MIPRKLILHNFLSYQDCALDLQGLGLAVLCGKNGDGKSALLDAMTWALWGHARGRLEDDRIRLGELEMLVDFEFEVEGAVFRVVRKRTKIRGGSSDLQLFQLDETGDWKALTGGIIRETQAEIVRRVRMDYETFANSAFVAQGKADEFTRRNATERKEVFRKILGLERYEALAGLANDHRKDASLSLGKLRGALEQAQQELESLPTVVARLGEVGARRAEIEPQVKVRQEEHSALQAAAADFERLVREREAASRRAEECAKAAAEGQAEITRLEGELKGARETLAGAEGIRERFARLQAARETESVMAATQAKALAAERRMKEAEAAIGEERARLEAQLAAATTEETRLRALAGQVEELRAKEAGLIKTRAEIAALSVRADTLRDEAAGKRAAAGNLTGEATRYKDEATELKALEAQLEGVAECPVCRQPLAPDQLDHVRGEYAARRRELGERYRAANAGAAEAENDADGLLAEANRLAEEFRGRDAAARTAEQTLHAVLTQAEDAAAKLPEAETSLAKLKAALDAESFAPEARAVLVAARKELTATAYDAAAHEAAREEVQSLSGAERDHANLLVAAERSKGLEERIARERESLAVRAQEHEAAIEVAAAASEAAAQAEDVTPRLEEAAAALGQLRDEDSSLTLEQGRLEERRGHLQTLQARIEAAADEQRALKEQEQTYGDLATAFGKNGVQAMLIEQSLPQLQIIANQMLERMTGGRINVMLKTQRENQKGAMVETLDILISDDMGMRDYDMYSGGEAFRVDFALRIALSKLLAARAGASLPTLIIDEGFGSQDAEGIDRLVESINAVASEFELILVVTHIEELKSRFERRIDVTKDSVRGSMAVVA